MKITSLLNPSMTDDSRQSTPFSRSRLTEPDSGRSSTPEVPLTQFSKRLKEVKDAPKYEEGRPVEPVSYPPFEADSKYLQKQYERFNIQPRNAIAKYPRNIPYSSEKKRLRSKTGRDYFNVFQYTFRYRESNDDEEYQPKSSDPDDWRVVWDYNIGLVRITPFFKSQLYQKTVPAKAINMNPGLMELCHSITGGALVAQGYWMPFDAAKALASTFCWKIRCALVPVFGPGFVNECIDPADPVYKRFTIPPEIIKISAADIIAWKSRSVTPSDKRSNDRYSRKPSSSPDSEPELPFSKRARTQRMNKRSADRLITLEPHKKGRGLRPRSSGFAAVNHRRHSSTTASTSLGLTSELPSFDTSPSKPRSDVSDMTSLTDVDGNGSTTMSKGWHKVKRSNFATVQSGNGRKRSYTADDAEAAEILLLFSRTMHSPDGTTE